MSAFLSGGHDDCPCGSGRPYITCCGPCHARTRIAVTAEELMRSRYSAYVLRDWDYLLFTWHSRTRPSRETLHQGPHPRWLGLEVLATREGRDAGESFVEFRARCRDGERLATLRETSRFLLEEGQWRYLDGELQEAGGHAGAIGRNAPCPCGSGRKYKRCCGSRA